MKPPITAMPISARMPERNPLAGPEFLAPAAAPDCGAGDTANTAASPDMIVAVIGRARMLSAVSPGRFTVRVARLP